MIPTTACASAAALWAWTALAQPCEPEWGEPFRDLPLIDHEVRALALFDDGSGPKVYAGGTFTQASGQPARGLMRWETDHWQEAAVVQGTTLNSTLPGIYFLKVMDIGDGPELFAGGQFSSIDGVPVTGIARWNGQRWSAMGAGFDLPARALAMYDAGTGPALYAAGRFTKSGTTTCRGLSRWTGSEWVQVGDGLSNIGGLANLTPIGYALGVYDLGQGPRLYVGGRFEIPGATPGGNCLNIAAWDGSSWSSLGSGLGGYETGVVTMLMFDHGAGPQLTVAGGIAVGTGQAVPRVARWTGSEWIQVGQTLPGGIYDAVSTMAVFPGPNGPTLHIGGTFGYGAQPQYAARLVNGAWTSMAVYGIVRSMIAIEDAGQPRLWAGGNLSVAGSAMVRSVAHWDGQEWAGLESGLALSGPARAACTFDDGSGERVVVGGWFVGAGTSVCNSIATWDGRTWRPVGGGMPSLPPFLTLPGHVNALASFDDGNGPGLYATGWFEVVASLPCKSFARWDGTSWTTPGGGGLWYQGSSAGAWLTGTGESMIVHDDGSGPALYVGGRIGRADTVLVDKVARWNGTAWSSPGGAAGAPGYEIVAALAEFDEGAGPRLFAGGNFKTIAGVQAYGIARWDGVAWSPVGGGFPPVAAGFPEVSDLATISSGTGSVLVAAGRYGNFASPLTTPLILARWDGYSWTPLTGGSGTVPLSGHIRHVWSFDDGDGPALYIGGTLNIPGTVVPTGMLRRRAGTWDMPGGGITQSSPSQFMGVYGTAIRREGGRDVLLMTGWFNSAGGEESVGVAEWRGCRTCYPDCDRDGALTIADFSCFQLRFTEADPYGDCNADDRLTVADFGCFQTKFAAGCP